MGFSFIKFIRGLKSSWALVTLCLLLFTYHFMFSIKLVESQITIDHVFYFYFILNSLFVVSLVLLGLLSFKKLRWAFLLLFLVPYFSFTLGTVEYVQRFGDIIRPWSYTNIDELLAMGTGIIKLFDDPYYLISITLGLFSFLFSLFSSHFTNFSSKFNKKIIFYNMLFIFLHIFITLNFIFRFNFTNKSDSKTSSLNIREVTDLYTSPLNYAVTFGFIPTYIGIYLEDNLLTKLAKNYNGTPGKLSFLLNETPHPNPIGGKDFTEQTSADPPHTIPNNPPTKPNFIFIQFESIDAWPLHYKFNGKSITPFLSNLKQHSLYFKNFYAIHHAYGGSSDAERASLLSLLPHSSKALNVKKSYRSLVSILKSYDYQTAVFHSNDKNFYNRGQLYENIGMDYKYFGKDAFHGEAAGMSAFDQPFYEQALTHIKEEIDTKRSFLFYFITMQSHHPFETYKQTTKNYLFGDLIKKYSREHIKFSQKERNLMDYITSIYEADQALKFFFKDLAKNNLLDNTFVFIYGDHNGNRIHLNCKGECIPLLIYHKDLPHEETIRTPSSKPHFLSRLVKNKKNSHWLERLNFKKGTYLKVASHLDISPTVTYILGTKESSHWLGSSLVSPQTILLTSKYLKKQNQRLAIKRKNDHYHIIPSGFYLEHLLKNEPIHEPFYYENGIALANTDFVITNSKNNPFELSIKNKRLLHYYIYSINKFEPFN